MAPTEPITKGPRKGLDAAIIAAVIGGTATILGVCITIWAQRDQAPTVVVQPPAVVVQQPPSASHELVSNGRDPEPVQEIKGTNRQEDLATSENYTLTQILDRLDKHRQRATYGAVGALIGVQPWIIFDGLPWTSRTEWVVNKDTGLPSKKSRDQLNKDLFVHKDILNTKEDLLDWLHLHP
jgi:hypothetical protein